MVLVRPSKFWHKPGAPGKEVWDAWQQCLKLPGKRDVSEACMKAQGFTYGKTDDIYVPPPRPKGGWVKPGVSQVDAMRVWRGCIGMRVNTAEIQAEINQCMAEQGFAFKKELSEDELPPCWYDPYPHCRDEPRPYR